MAEARKTALRCLLELADDTGRKSLGVDEILDVAALAHSFIEHPYWRRMSLMLMNTEKEELETLLDPTQADKHAMSRASVANLRKLLAMPHIDIAQGEKAVYAVERHQERFGDIAHQGVTITGTHKGAREK